MTRGVFYGVGVGPGDPKLITLKAVETIRDCPVVAAPRTRNGGMVALDIARGAVSLDGKEILPLDFAMSREAAERRDSHLAAARLVRERLDAGQSVAMLNLGDVSIYSSYRYLADLLGPEGYSLKMIPGVTSFCAAAAVQGFSLTDMDSELRIVPDETGIPENPDRPGTTIYMKSGKQLPALLEKIAAAGLGDKTSVVQNCGMPGERVIAKLGPELGNGEIADAYFSLVIVRNGVRNGARNGVGEGEH